jgi:hypothetical protein
LGGRSDDRSPVPQLRFVFDCRVVNLFVKRKFDGNFRRRNFPTPFGKPDFAKTAFAEFIDKRIRSDCLRFPKHSRFPLDFRLLEQCDFADCEISCQGFWFLLIEDLPKIKFQKLKFETKHYL